MGIKLKIIASLVVITVTGFVVLDSMEASAQCQESNQGMAVMQIETISLLNDNGKIVELESHIADDAMKRSHGYQYICEEIIDKTTILFVYPWPTDGQFHMRNVKAALDIGFFDAKGRLIRAMKMDPYDDGNSRLYHPGHPFQFALEARAGFFKDHHFSENRARLVVHSVNNSP